ncbi:MAG: hypothetical protein JWL84_1272 [Rhodospirillales bacterium]|nr:hypothetical protein [Rhodospirillales bacterium]
MGRQVPRFGLTGTAVALVLALAAGRPAWAQMAVYDAAVHMETSQTLAQAIKLLDSAQQQLSQLNSLRSALGSAGAAAGGLASPLRSLNASLAPPAFDGWNLPRDMQAPNLASMSSSRDFLGQALAVTPDKNSNIAFGDRDAAVQRRQLAARDAAMNGYSLALAQRQQIQPALERAASLADQATSATTLMDQQRTTNYLLAAIAGELVAQRSLMASYLEVVSTKALQDQPVIYTGSPPTTYTAPACSGLLGQ